MTLTDEQKAQAEAYRDGYSLGAEHRAKGWGRTSNLNTPPYWDEARKLARRLGYADGHAGEPRDSTQAYDLGADDERPLPLRARIAMRIQRAVDRILDPWLRLIPDDPNPEVTGIIERVKEGLREEGRQEVVLELIEVRLADHAESHGGRKFDA